MIKATITIDDNTADVKKIFAAEEKSFQNNRSKYKVVKKNKKLMFEITAKDTAALRAVLNSITKNITVYQKVREVVENE
jgi:tRNA threonylcarbamoyladenosine modification (KEOPS) complex  Pcc1 subunit